MSDLENQVKPIIESFLLGEQVSLNPCDQTTLAVWICKNAMVCETFRLESLWFFTSQERKLFRESIDLPLHTFIWIAKSVGFTGLFYTGSDLSGIAIKPINQVNASITTMAFGPIAIQILNLKMVNPFPQNMTITGNPQPGPWNQTIIQIWPITVDLVLWPNEIGLNGELGLDNFARRWGPIK
jgi:hypothetical protein